MSHTQLNLDIDIFEDGIAIMPAPPVQSPLVPLDSTHNMNDAAAGLDCIPMTEEPLSSILGDPNFVTDIPTIKHSLEFIRLMREAALESDVEPIPPALIDRIRFPPQFPLTIDDPDQRLSMETFIHLLNSAQHAYDAVRNSICRRYPDSRMLSYEQVRTKFPLISYIH